MKFNFQRMKQLINTTLISTSLLIAHAVYAEHLYTGVNMMKGELLLINVETDELIIKPLTSLPGWPIVERLQHAWITADEKTIYLNTDAVENKSDALIIALDVGIINWTAKTVDLSIKKIIKMADDDTKSHIPTVTQTSPNQPIPAWTTYPTTQIHGPTFLPNSKYAYNTIWTNNEFRVLNLETNELAKTDMMSFGDKSRQKHGINFNSTGKRGVTSGYCFDCNEIHVYVPNRKTGALKLIKSIKLGTDKEYAAYAHYTQWVDDRHIVVGTMQLDRTSATPADATIIGPSVWLVDTLAGTAKKIIDTVSDENGEGVYRSASDVAIANNKLYIAEEDTLSDVFGRDGFVSIFDIKDINNPKFIKRLKPGNGLPSLFAVGHTTVTTLDEKYVYVSSYYSHHIVKIDTAKDEVVKVYSMDDGLDMPHGEYLSGRIR